MPTIREGSRVSYIGYGQSGLALGDQGMALAAAGSASHVKWLTGSAAGQILLTPNEDLVQATATRDDAENDLSSGPLVAVAVRDVYDEAGEVGLINALAESGHLAGFSEIAEEALEWVQGKIGNDPSIVEVLGHLDPAEQSDVLTFMATALLRDAFGHEES